MTPTLHAARIAAVVDGFSRAPAYAGLAAALRLAIGDGRLPLGARLPSERALTDALGVSRTTVTRAYAELAEQGYAHQRRGSGTFTTVPGGRGRTLDRALSTRPTDDGVIDLNCAASSAPPGLAEAYRAALEELPVYLSGHGYFPAGLPALQQQLAQGYDARGLATAPDQIVVTSGALAAAATAARMLVRPGDRVLVESPSYPNATEAFTGAGARLISVPVTHQGWDVDLLVQLLTKQRPRVAYLVPDFHNPTAAVMPDHDRARVAQAAAAAGTTVVVDESHQALSLTGRAMPRPLGKHLVDAGAAAITVGGASKMLWGGLRVGWARVDTGLLDRFTHARLALDLGTPVLEQLAVCQLLGSLEATLAFHRQRLREQRDALARGLRTQVPEWSFEVPDGGLALWCALPRPHAADLAVEAEARGVIVAPGPVFAPEGGLSSWVRVPYTRPEHELEQAAATLAQAWDAARRPRPGGPKPTRAMVA